MKDEINLLPPPLRNARHNRILWSRLGRLLRYSDAALMLVAMVTGVLIGVFSYLTTTLKNSSAPLPPPVSSELRVKNTNTLLAAIQAKRTRYTWSQRVLELLQNLPPDMLFTHINVEENNNVMAIEGIFKDRATLVDFEATLRALSWVESVEAPLKNFAVGSNTRFTFELKPKGNP